MYRLVTYGIRTPHRTDMSPDSINLSDFVRLLCFQTSGTLRAGGEETVSPGDVILYPPSGRGTSASVTETVRGLDCDWILFSTDDPGFPGRLGLPFGVLLHTHNPYFIRDYLTLIDAEVTRRQPFMDECVSNAIDGMLIALARFYASRRDPHTDYDERLYNLRQTLLQNYQKTWTVREMAEAVNLSMSYFSALYRRLFHVSPNNDLLNIRIQAAKLKLRSTNASLRQIAAECGFLSEYYFSAAFKKRTGFPPSAYRAGFAGEEGASAENRGI